MTNPPFFVLLAILFSLSLTACGEKDAPNPPTAVATATEAAPAAAVATATEAAPAATTDDTKKAGNPESDCN